MLILCSLLALPWVQVAPVRADSNPQSAVTPTPDPTKRQTELTIDVYQYEWWLTRWKGNSLECSIVVEHPGFPYASEILSTCGPDQYEDWSDTTTCDKEDKTLCPGVYLSLVHEGPNQKKIVVDLPPAEAWLSLRGCTLQPPQNRCNTLPDLMITGLEPLPNEAIIRIEGFVNGIPFSCPGGECALALKPTGEKGVPIEFWSVSSFGDTSKHYTALVRVLPWGDFMNPESRGSGSPVFYVDVLSSQWRGQRAASCTETWQVFPDVGGPPHWLSTPRNPEELSSADSYYYLAGMLIQNGAVDASGCPSGGLQDKNTANTCGLEVSMRKAQDWQNQFDSDIYKVSRDTGVPAYMMKNIFRRESQFWPGIYKTMNESGLGQMTDNGADTILLWNPSFYEQFCPLVLSTETCQTSFSKLNEDHQRMLRGALVVKVNADCKDCMHGIDLTKASFSIKVFADTLLANCEQTGRIIYNITQHMPGSLTSYQDLWRFTLVNYNAGAGCLANAISRAWGVQEPLDWEHISSHLDENCQGAIPYVEDVTELSSALPTPTPWYSVPTRTPPPSGKVTPQPDAKNFGG